MAAAADRNLLFGLLALQNGLINQGQLVAAFQAWTLDKSRPGRPSGARGDLDADGRAALEALAALHLKKHGATPRRAWPRSRPASRPARAWPGSATPRSRRRSATSPRHRLDRGRRRRPHGHPTPSAPRPATASGSASSGPTPGAGWGRSSWRSTRELHREVALKQILDHHADDPVSRQRFLLEAEITGGLEHPGIVPGLRPGHLRRRPALLRDAVHPGRQPQGGDRAVPRRRGPERTTRAGGRWSCASSCGGSSTSATRSTTPTAGASCTATSSRAT